MMRIYWLATVLLTMLLLQMSLAGGYKISGQPVKDKRCKDNPAPVTELGKRERFSVQVSANGPMEPISAPDMRYMRVQVVAKNPAPKQEGCNWLLTIRDEKFRLVQTMTAIDFKDSSFKWTNRVPGAQVWLDLRACPDHDPAISVEQYIAMPIKTQHPYYSSENPLSPRYQALYEEKSPGKSAADTEFRPLGDYVGFLMASWGEEPNRLSWCCSGVVVAPTLFLTNWHCGGPGRTFDNGQARDFDESLYWDDVILMDMLIDMSWDGDNVSREYICTKVEESSPELDYALLRIEPVNSTGALRVAPISQESLKKDQPIYIVHHPECMEKQITTAGCKVSSPKYKGWRSEDGSKMYDFTHTCDTEGGSSGAPVFNKDSQLIGIHHLGYSFGPPPLCKRLDQLNKSLHITEILKHLSDIKRDDLVKEITRRH